MKHPECSCDEQVCVFCAIRAAGEHALAETPIPDASRVWRVAQMRARREAATSAGRPITAAHVLAFACAMGLMGACFGATSLWFQEALRATIQAISTHNLWPPVLAGTGLTLLLLPAALYLVLRDE